MAKDLVKLPTARALAMSFWSAVGGPGNFHQSEIFKFSFNNVPDIQLHNGAEHFGKVKKSSLIKRVNVTSVRQKTLIAPQKKGCNIRLVLAI